MKCNKVQRYKRTECNVMYGGQTEAGKRIYSERIRTDRICRQRQ